jgi:hypothetical protein
MTSDTEREQQLRRLLSEAVEPVEPAAGAQTRLLARVRAQAQRKSRGPLILRWGVPVVLASLAVVVVVTLAFAINRGGGSNSSASTSAGGATVKSPAKGPAGAAQASAGPSTAADAKRSALSPVPATPQFDSGKSATTNNGSIPGAATTDLDGRQLSLARSADLDGDGSQELIAVQGGSLLATLSRDGVQRVTLPPPVASGAGVLGVTTLSDPNGNAVTVVFVRLTQAGTAATDTVAAVVDGRLTVLRQGTDPVLLTIDPTHGYGCDQRSVAMAGNTTPFVVDGAQLVASPELRGVITPPAKALGCGF